MLPFAKFLLASENVNCIRWHLHFGLWLITLVSLVLDFYLLRSQRIFGFMNPISLVPNLHLCCACASCFAFSMGYRDSQSHIRRRGIDPEAPHDRSRVLARLRLQALTRASIFAERAFGVTRRRPRSIAERSREIVLREQRLLEYGRAAMLGQTQGAPREFVGTASATGSRNAEIVSEGGGGGQQKPEQSSNRSDT